MRVAFIVPSLRRTGPILMVRDLVIHLKNRGYSVSVYYFDDCAEVEFNCDVKRIPFWHFSSELAECDVLHTHLLRPNAYVWFHSKKLGGVMKITTLHNYVYSDLRYEYGRMVSVVFGWLWLFLLRAQNRLVVLSDDAARYYSSLIGRGYPLKVIPNGRDLEIIESPAEDGMASVQKVRSQGKTVLGACALLTQRKGLEQAINLLAIMPDCHLVLVGDGPARNELEALARSIGVDERCLFIGFRENATSYMSMFDVYLMPSRSEGLPLALLEAAAAGIPLVCSDIPPLRENFDGAAQYFSLDDIDSLQCAVKSVLKEPEVWGRLAKERYLARFTGKAMADAYAGVYEQLCENTR